MPTEVHFAKIARLEGRGDVRLPTDEPDALPQTEAANRELIKLPSFPSADRELLDQYVVAFEKVSAHADEIATQLGRSDGSQGSE